MRSAAFFLLLLFGTSPLGHALETAPFRVFNQNPLVQIFGLPPAAGGEVLDPGRSEAVLALDAASHFSDEEEGGEGIFLDGETYRLALALRYGIAGGLEIGAEIPWIAHDGGFLDGFIEGWHDFFGLPQGGREEAPRDRLLFLYREDGNEELRLDEEADGLGDIRLSAGWALPLPEGPTEAALRASLKLPTGDSDRLLGSGSTDLALWLTADRELPSDWGRFALFGSGGVLLLSDGDILPDRQRNAAGFGTLGGAWRPRDWLAFKVQFDGHTALYDSALPQLGKSVQLTVGGTLDWGNTALDLGVSEDLVVDSAPDVVFHLALRSRF